MIAKEFAGVAHQYGDGEKVYMDNKTDQDQMTELESGQLPFRHWLRQTHFGLQRVSPLAGGLTTFFFKYIARRVRGTLLRQRGEAIIRG